MISVKSTFSTCLDASRCANVVPVPDPHLLINVSFCHVVIARGTELVPSSARSTSSSAAPLPSQLVPLLDETFQRVKLLLDKALPLGKKRTALEEAEFEDDEPEGALEREILMQSKLNCVIKV